MHIMYKKVHNASAANPHKVTLASMQSYRSCKETILGSCAPQHERVTFMSSFANLRRQGNIFIHSFHEVLTQVCSQYVDNHVFHLHLKERFTSEVKGNLSLLNVKWTSAQNVSLAFPFSFTIYSSLWFTECMLTQVLTVQREVCVYVCERKGRGISFNTSSSL